MFVYIIGNSKENIFKLGIARDPFKHLTSIQSGNPYKLSVISKLCVESKNAATLMEGLGRKRLSEYEGAGEWFVNLPDGLHEQFGNGHYLRSLAASAGVKIAESKMRSLRRKGTNLQGLSDIAKDQGLTFEDILGKVEQAYDEGVSIDKIICQ